MSVDLPGSPRLAPSETGEERPPLVGGVLEPAIEGPQVPTWCKPSTLKAICIAVDVVAVALGLLISFGFTSGFQLFGTAAPKLTCLVVGAASLPVWVLIFARYRLYKARFTNSRMDELNRLTHSTLVGVLMIGALSYLLRLHVARSWTLCSFVAVLVCTWVARQGVRGYFRRLRRQGWLKKRVLIAGANEEAMTICRQLRADPALGYEVVGLLGGTGEETPEVRNVGAVRDALSLAASEGAQGVILVSSAIGSLMTNRLARELTEVGLHVELSSALWDIGYERLTIQPVGYHPTIYVEPIYRNGWRQVAKRLFDLTVAGLGLIALTPVMLAVALWVKLDSQGPVFFTQVRAGRDERPFRVIKFRSMVTNAEELLLGLLSQNEADGPLFKLRADPRVTRAGRILRRYSLDELPQLFNVLLGQMSVVGPRPALFTEMQGWTDELRNAKLQVRPGLTGIWQVSGRSNLSFEDYVKLDLFYVYNWNLWRDLSIVARTVPVLVNSKGAF